MKASLLLVVAAASLLIFVSAYSLPVRNAQPASEANAISFPRTDDIDASTRAGVATSRYRLDAANSKFIAHATRSGLLWFKGHGHDIAVREFTGEAVLEPAAVQNSSLTITAKTASMEETSSVFTAPQKQIINKELREIVLLPDQYPEIVFRSTAVKGKSEGAGQYDLKITGNLTLNGVTRPVTIPTKVTISGNRMRAQGEFSISRGDFNVKATSAFHGMVRVSDKVKFEFDILGREL
jgi:polyisoprenoid-binding protein YceI